jgi:lipopolysaccharide transport system permease protein
MEGRVIEINEPASRLAFPSLREVWRHRELIYYLGRREVAVRYRQTFMGVLWVVLQPLLLAAIFTLFLGLLDRHVPSGGVAYPLFVLAGMTMWLFLSGALGKCSESTISNAQLISKVYFPRLVIPLSALIQPLVDFVASFVVLVVLIFIDGTVPPARIVLMPLLLILAAGSALSVGLWFSALIVRYRDVKQVITFLLQALIFVTPVLYPLSIIPSSYRILYSLNPFVGVLETYRWLVLPDAPAPGAVLLVSVTTTVLLIVSGLVYFGRAENDFADVV